jgi:Zn-dependent peptidase ImmA (M78 family)
MNLRERYGYLNDLLKKAKEEYEKNPQFSTELGVVSLEAECQQLLLKIDEEEQNLYPREKVDFYKLYPPISISSMEIIKKLGDKIELPIDVRKIATSCGFDRIELDDGSRSGKHATAKNNIIYVNKNEPEEEQRFSIAHEIGHKVLDSRRDILKNVARKGNHWKADVLSKELPVSNEEKETLIWEEIIDYFAANLLMPTHIFYELSSHPDEIIASRFHVSEKSLRKRRTEIIHEIKQVHDEQEEQDQKS